MKKFNSFLITIAILLFATAGYTQSEEELRNKIEKINKKMAKDMVAGDYMASIDYYAEDAVSLPNWRDMIRGKEKMRQQQKEMMEEDQGKINDFNFETVEIMQCGDKIIEIGKYKMSMETPKMPQTIHDHGKYMTVWEVQNNGDLRIKADIWNTSQNPMAFMEYMKHDEEMKAKKDYHDEEYRDKEKWEDDKKWKEKKDKKDKGK